MFVVVLFSVDALSAAIVLDLLDLRVPVVFSFSAASAIFLRFSFSGSSGIPDSTIASSVVLVVVALTVRFFFTFDSSVVLLLAASPAATPGFGRSQSMGHRREIRD